ncbi:hypothetical protein NPIL_628111 [Nephila pilipes]|uniref:Uncharacterized protein n=1 Tax=Nephila pilipes TaxID=299642 RepID=A0A8X6PN45_NEPPI|nr:hypothetical protein NPIL_628111 [Nephila pilipes]
MDAPLSLLLSQTSSYHNNYAPMFIGSTYDKYREKGLGVKDKSPNNERVVSSDMEFELKRRQKSTDTAVECSSNEEISLDDPLVDSFSGFQNAENVDNQTIARKEICIVMRTQKYGTKLQVPAPCIVKECDENMGNIDNVAHLPTFVDNRVRCEVGA